MVTFNPRSDPGSKEAFFKDKEDCGCYITFYPKDYSHEGEEPELMISSTTDCGTTVPLSINKEVAKMLIKILSKFVKTGDV